MFNQFILIGEVVGYTTISTYAENGKDRGLIAMKVQRDFRNLDGSIAYDTLYVNCYDFLAEMASEFKTGTKIAAKGRIAYRKNQTMIIAERLIAFGNA